MPNPDPGQPTPTNRRPLHEVIRPLGYVRTRLRTAVLRAVNRLFQTDDGKHVLAASLGDLLRWRDPAAPGADVLRSQPYLDLGRAPETPPASRSAGAVIITARFRSGSTLLWNLVRHLDGFTAYYEPFNERRWFDPHARGSRIDPTHRQAEEYWREYDGLGILAEHYCQRWIDHDLFMDADSWNPAMYRYVELLIQHARGRPALQFNRIDFRLAWFRRHFPAAKIIHLHRHPRDQWCSTLVDPAAFTKDHTVAEFAPHDHYYLLDWVRDLKYRFPFLQDAAAARHPYRLFYFLWKLSFVCGRCHAHHSFAFEDLVTRPDDCLAALLRELDVPRADAGGLKGLIEKPRLGRWTTYADDRWFREHEEFCEGVLAEFFAGARDQP
jgi:hypothetical protein